jgi:DNA-directed RNA polymerase subunit RPC12/RpoP
MVTVVYKCINCGKELEKDLEKEKKIQCPFCGYRIIEKKRSVVIKKVLAR